MLHKTGVLRGKKNKLSAEKQAKDRKKKQKPFRLTCLTEISSEMQRAVTGRHSATRQLQLVTCSPIMAGGVVTDTGLIKRTFRRMRGSSWVCCAHHIGDCWLTCQNRGTHQGSGGRQNGPAENWLKVSVASRLMEYAHFYIQKLLLFTALLFGTGYCAVRFYIFDSVTQRWSGEEARSRMQSTPGFSKKKNCLLKKSLERKASTKGKAKQNENKGPKM